MADLQQADETQAFAESHFNAWAPRPRVAIGLFVVLAFPVLLMGLDDYGVVNADEAFYHDIAWTMLETGDWWKVRTGSGEHVYDTFANAPLQYWGRGGVIAISGPGIFGMRILSALAGLLTVVATYSLTLSIAGRAAAFLSGLLLLGNYAFVYLHGARTGELETGVTLLLVGLVATFIRALQRPKSSFIPHHLLLVALLGWKAPVVPIPILAEIAAFALLPAARRRGVDWLRTGLWVVVPGALIWHGYHAWRMQAFLPQVIDAIGAQAGGPSMAQGLLGRASWYLERAWFGAWPQIALLPAALLALREHLKTLGSGSADAVRLVAIFFVSILIFYCSISKVGPWYLNHSYPFLAILIAIGMLALVRQGTSFSVPLFFFALGLAAIPYIAPPLLNFDPFAESAIRLAMPLEIRGIAPLPPVVAIGLTALALMGFLGLMTKRGGGAGLWVFGFVGVVVLLSALRVTWPLHDLKRQSAGYALFLELDERRSRQVEPSFPIEVEPVHPWIVHYYFGHHYVIQPAPPRAGDPGPPRQRYHLIAPRS